MSEEPDYSSLPLDQRLVHKVWKVRLEAYDELSKLFENSRNENDEIFQEFNNRPELLKQFITDSNVVAQENAINSLVNYLKYGGTINNVARLKSIGIITSIIEKGLSSNRKNTKEYSIESLLLMIEISKDPNSLIEDFIPTFSNRLPKLVSGSVQGLNTIISNFGCQIISPRLIIPALPKLFAHADRNVRSETTQLTVELYKWMGDNLSTILFPDLKPIQQKDLTKAFEAVTGTVPEQKRLTREQELERRRLEEAAAAAAAAQSANGATDIIMTDADLPTISNHSTSSFDPFDLVEPVEILSKLPNDFESRLSSSKWKDRVEVLEEVHIILDKAVKLVTNDDYSQIIRLFAKCMKDANIQVVQLAANCIEYISNGLKKNFHRYQHLVLPPIIDRLKEKKASVATALANALDSIFRSSSLSDILDDTLNGLKSKIPQNKISSANYLQRCLAATTVPPTSNEIDSIMQVGVKLLSESQEPIRQASTEMIGTLMKITGQRELAGFLEKVDDNRKSKITAFYESVQVNATSKSSTSSNSNSTISKRSQIPPLNSGTIKRTRPPVSAPTSIPAKRGASSPVKRVDDTPKSSTIGRGLTGRSLASSSISNLPHPQSHVNPPLPKQTFETFSNQDKEELINLRKEKEESIIQRERDAKRIKQGEEDNYVLKQEILNLQSKLDSLQKDLANNNRMLKQKDQQITRLNHDLEDAKLKIRDSEQKIEIIKLQQTNKQSTFSGGLYSGTSQMTFSSPSTTSRPISYISPEKTRITSGELSSEVKRLSLDGGETSNTNINTSRENSYLTRSNNFNRISSSQPFGYTSSIDSPMEIEADWKRAAEVTSQLKARIEKMKARNRNNNNTPTNEIT
ncbi:armadillo-type protein [Scheffersomyces amazonensis]|uniref:armadillo-type protein n=1 Tax=Scheffersomyces amazonensis TaxID=1078765 RepID=UPI00315C71ED